MKGLIIVVLSLTLFACAQETKVTPAHLNQIVLKVSNFKFDSIRKSLDNYNLLDVRTPREFKQGFIGDAVNVNFLEQESFKKKVAALDKSTPVLLYCQAGGRSSKALNYLVQQGFDYVVELKNGYGNYKP